MAMNARSRFLATPKKEIQTRVLWVPFFLNGRPLFEGLNDYHFLMEAREKQELLRNYGQIDKYQ
jgi:hypothetical protein